MKKHVSSILALLMVIGLTGCASKPSAPVINKNQDSEKLRFDDWKYKGFGQELPFWVETAIDSDIKSLKKILPEMYNVSALTVVTGIGENMDQADQSAKDKIEDLVSRDSEYKYYDSFWVREDTTERKIDMPYKSVYVYYKE